MPARSPASIARRRCTSTSPACSPTPIRCAPIAATAGRKRATSSSAWSTSPPTNWASIRPNCAGATTSRPQQMPFKTGLTFTYDCGEFEKNMDLALELADIKGFKRAARGLAQARQAARHRHVQHHRARRRRRHRRRRSALRPRRHRDPVFRIDDGQAKATKPCSSNWCATGSGSIPTRCDTSRATPMRCSTAKAPAARAPQRCRARPSRWRPKR